MNLPRIIATTQGAQDLNPSPLTSKVSCFGLRNLDPLPHLVLPLRLKVVHPHFTDEETQAYLYTVPQ